MRAAILIFAMALVTWACNTPTSPSLARARPQLSLEGPPSVTPGGTLHYRVMASEAGLPPRDVTASATWLSDNANQLKLTTPGTFAAGTKSGEANISASYNGGFALNHIYVLEDGTFSIHGHVRDGNYPVPGARIDVIAGIGTGSSATTGTDGAYVLYGVAGTVTLTATLQDYTTASQTFTLTDQTTVDFNLQLSVTRPSLAGQWTMTFTASPSCAGLLPDEAAQRIYPVAITQTDAAVKIVLTLQQPAYGNFNTVNMDARLLGRTLLFTIPGNLFDGPDIYEKLSSGLFFSLDGTATIDVSGSDPRGVLNGRFTVSNQQPPPSSVFVACGRTDHSVTLTRAGSMAAWTFSR